MNKILVVEDDVRLGPTIRKGLRENGYVVSLASSGDEAMTALTQEQPDLLILDLGLPDMDGVDLLQKARCEGFRGLVLILTARDGITDRIKGLDAGADDYLIKPFAFMELLARLRALFRRTSAASRVLYVGNMQINLITREVKIGDESIELTPREFDLLAYLAEHSGQVVSRDMITDNVWREPSRFTSLDNVIDVHVSRLRRKLTDEDGCCPLRVIRNSGLMLGGKR